MDKITELVIPILLTAFIALLIWLVKRSYANERYIDTCIGINKSEINKNTTQIGILEANYNNIKNLLAKIEHKLDKLLGDE